MPTDSGGDGPYGRQGGGSCRQDHCLQAVGELVRTDDL